MKRVLISGVVAVAMATSAQADFIGGRWYDASAHAYFGHFPAGPGILATGWDSSQGFVPGWIGGQNGWASFASSTAQGSVTNANPLGGDQNLRIAFDPALPNGTNTGAFSPSLGAQPVGSSITSVDIYISNTGGADYDVVPQAPTQGLLSARVKFNFLGNIFILDNPGSGLQFIDTGVAWNVGVYTNLTIDINPTADTIEYYYGGNLIHSSMAGVFAGTATEQVVLLSDNWHLPGEAGDFDNFSVVPSPGTLAMLGLAGLIGRRRRKA